MECPKHDVKVPNELVTDRGGKDRRAAADSFLLLTHFFFWRFAGDSPAFADMWEHTWE